MAISQGTTNNIWRIIPGIEAVTLYRRLADRTLSATTVAISKAKRKQANADDIVAMGLTGQTVIEWGLWASTFASVVVPAVGDVIHASSTDRWSIKRVTKKLFGNVYNCMCTKEL